MDLREWWDSLKAPKKDGERRFVDPPPLERPEPGETAAVRAAATVQGNPVLYHDGLYTSHLLQVVRLALVGGGILAGSLIGAVVWNISLYPLKTKETEYVFFGNGQYMHVAKGKIEAKTLDLLIDDELKKYVENRETIDHTTEKTRFDWVRAHTDPKWFKPWESYMSAANPSSPLEKYRREEKKRNVYVNSLVRTSTANEYQAEMTFIERNFGGLEIGRSEWIVVFKAVRQDISGSADLVKLNSLGLIVKNYDAKPRTRAEADKARGVQ